MILSNWTNVQNSFQPTNYIGIAVTRRVSSGMQPSTYCRFCWFTQILHYRFPRHRRWRHNRPTALLYFFAGKKIIIHALYAHTPANASAILNIMLYIHKHILRFILWARILQGRRHVNVRVLPVEYILMSYDINMTINGTIRYGFMRCQRALQRFFYHIFADLLMFLHF